MVYENIIIIVIAIILDFLIGDPENFPHPIRYIGKIINHTENMVRKRFSNLKIGGLFLLIVSVLSVIAIITTILYILKVVNIYLYYIIKTYIIFSGIAGKCLYDECMKVYRIIVGESIEKARVQLSYLVGRDTKNLDKKEIIRATVETAAENTVDGVLAPIFFAFIGGLLGVPAQAIYFYKTVNTLDSMVGYNNEKYGEIGFFSAKFDDILNLVPARLGSVFIAIAGIFSGYSFLDGLRIMIRDRRNHKSPNCAYPEGTVAGLLGIQLGGTNMYFGKAVYKPTIGDSHREIEAEDIKRACNLIYSSEAVFTVFMISSALIIINFWK